MYARVTYATKYTKQSAQVTNVTIKQKIELVTNLRSPNQNVRVTNAPIKQWRLFKVTYLGIKE